MSFDKDTFVLPLRDPETGRTRDVILQVDKGLLLATLSKSRAPAEDSPHHATADFSPHAALIAKALLGS